MMQRKQMKKTKIVLIREFETFSQKYIWLPII
jgi:hypothetical protein